MHRSGAHDAVSAAAGGDGLGAVGRRPPSLLVCENVLAQVPVGRLCERSHHRVPAPRSVRDGSRRWWRWWRWYRRRARLRRGVLRGRLPRSGGPLFACGLPCGYVQRGACAGRLSGGSTNPRRLQEKRLPKWRGRADQRQRSARRQQRLHGRRLRRRSPRHFPCACRGSLYGRARLRVRRHGPLCRMPPRQPLFGPNTPMRHRREKVRGRHLRKRHEGCGRDRY